MSNCDFEELCPKNIISPICFQLNHKENNNKDRSSDATLKSQKQVELLYTYKYPFLSKSLNSVLWPTLYGPRRSDTWIVFYIVVFYIVHFLCLPPPPHPSFRVWYISLALIKKHGRSYSRFYLSNSNNFSYFQTMLIDLQRCDRDDQSLTDPSLAVLYWTRIIPVSEYPLEQKNKGTLCTLFLCYGIFRFLQGTDARGQNF